MDNTTRQMIEILKRLRDDYGCIAVKAEFEAEGSRTDEMIILNEAIHRADMDLIVKIGGCEAVRDLDQCRLLGASGIMGPMIETPFAMTKFKGAAEKVYGEDGHSIDWIINTETITCNANLNEILEAGAGFVNTIAIGRVDLSASMGLSRQEINGDRIYEVAVNMAKIAKAKGINVGIGGGISFDAIDFILKMSPYIDRFETRKIVFQSSCDKQRILNGILLAMEFELLYLENKSSFYSRMANEDLQRLEMLKKRISDAKTSL